MVNYLHPPLHLVEIKLTRQHDAEAGYGLVMGMVGVRVEKVRVHLEGPLQVEPLDVQHAVDGG